MGVQEGDRFTLLDVMGLVAASAVGVALARFHFEQVASVSRPADLWEARG